ncbi:SMP-30/Gluconolaconase/LRE-like region [Teratosphaeria destructans]|uniref:SMP-30/Gluconolaconase/LRE-like region n=1 Tax=Teratosphaeria destructans TaxID=418781 RepID=A0A9W7VZ03_9PEZI|nr:SMP-30/Gluconolaconase/LRE-like region [Teratosphaeria destructans]
MALKHLFAVSLLTTPIFSQLQPPGVNTPVVTQYTNITSANVVVIDRYAAVLPYHYYRAPSAPGADIGFGETSVGNDSSFDLVATADFLVFDASRGLEALGPNPTYEVIFNVSKAVHEAPVYVPSLNKLFLSQLAPPSGYLPQLVVDLNQDPPTLSEYLSDPPVYAPNGGTFHDGLIYWGASGGIDSLGGTEQRPGIRTLDPLTNKTVTLLNNYFGFYFNTVDDLVVDHSGAIWFTDPQYSWFNRLTDTAPQLRTASYRFDPKTGAVTIVDDTLIQPNGIAISPDCKYVYISDTGAVTGSILQDGPPGTPFNQTGIRTVYKFDLVDHGTNLANRRPIYYALEWVPDGLKMAANGWLATATGKGVDVLDEYGVLILRIQTNYIVQNFVWVGEDMTELWMMGQGGISRVTWDLKGQDVV